MKEHQLQSNYRVSLKALIQDDQGRILLIQEDRNEFGLPGGGLDHGENITTGLRREIREELGVEIANINEQPVLVHQLYVPDLNRHGLWIVYRVELANPPIGGKVTRGWQYFDSTVLKSGRLDPVDFDGIRKLFELNT